MINGVPTVIYNGVTYTYIYFHGGNHVNNTSGCVLTAYKRRSNDEIYSTSERAVFYPIRAALDVGDTVTIDIQNDFEDIHQYRWKG
jgi:flagellar basal body L-ring protein FlgH